MASWEREDSVPDGKRRATSLSSFFPISVNIPRSRPLLASHRSQGSHSQGQGEAAAALPVPAGTTDGPPPAVPHMRTDLSHSPGPAASPSRPSPVFLYGPHHRTGERPLPRPPAADRKTDATNPPPALFANPQYRPGAAHPCPWHRQTAADEIIAEVEKLRSVLQALRRPPFGRSLGGYRRPDGRLTGHKGSR